MTERHDRNDMADDLATGPILERSLVRNDRYARAFKPGVRSIRPSCRVAIVACMDTRLNVASILGLATGDAHIIRNAGGLATDDAIRSLVISQHLLGTSEVIVVGHTDCGMLMFEDEPIRAQISAETGVALDLPLHPFSDLESSLSDQVDRIRAHPWIKPVPVSGLIYEVETGRVRQVA